MTRIDDDTDRILHAARVGDVMTTDLVTCTPDVPLADVAELMVRHRIHSLVVLAPPGDDPSGDDAGWSILSDLDLVGGVPWGVGVDGAGSLAASPRAVVGPDASLAEAALVMAENATAHLVVVQDGDRSPIGIISALDVARALAGATSPRGRHEPRPDALRVRPGDRLLIAAHHQGGRPRDAEVLEVRGEGGGPPYLVRWEDTGRVSIHYPGSDATVQHLAGGG